jgi:hypothetical protein
MSNQITKVKIIVPSIPSEIRQTIALSWITTLLILITAVVYFFITQPELPIFYSLATSQDQLADKIFLFVFPLLSFGINFLHLFIFKILQQYSSVLLKLYAGTTLGLQVVLLLALVRIVLITI